MVQRCAYISASRHACAERAVQASLGAAAFKAKALPIHVNLTHTPPVLAEDAKDVAQIDPGFIGQTTLTPTTFNTGSYGWKGSKRVTIELENDSGIKEKVQVMMTCVDIVLAVVLLLIENI